MNFAAFLMSVIVLINKPSEKMPKPFSVKTYSESNKNFK
jgi:hypothetical protein